MQKLLKAGTVITTERNINEKTSFLSHVSHSIRTPLNSIMGYSKLLQLHSSVDPKQEEYIRGILKGSRLLLHCIENIIYLSKIETYNFPLKIKKHSISKILWKILEEFKQERNEDKDYDINVSIIGDLKEDKTDIEIDLFLFKEVLKRMINIFPLKHSIKELELGYYKIENNKLSVFLRPTEGKKLPRHIFDEYLQRNMDEKNPFDYFNLDVLNSFIDLLNGSLTVTAKNQEISFVVPRNYPM